MVVWCVGVRPVRQGWSLWTSVTVKSASRELSGVCWPSDGKWEGRLLLSSRGGDDDFSLAEPGAHRRAVLLSTDEAVPAGRCPPRRCIVCPRERAKLRMRKGQ